MISTPEQRKLHIHGLRLAAEKIQREGRERETKNYENVMKYFAGKAKTQRGKNGH